MLTDIIPSVKLLGVVMVIVAFVIFMLCVIILSVIMQMLFYWCS